MSAAGALAPAPGDGMPPSAIHDIGGGGKRWTDSNSLMFLIYMVIGFSVTLGVILLLLLIYCCARRALRARRATEQAPSQGGSATASEGDSSRAASGRARPAFNHKQLVLVAQPGGKADVAYIEDPEQNSEQQSRRHRIRMLSASLSEGGSFSIRAHHQEPVASATRQQQTDAEPCSTAQLAPPARSAAADGARPVVVRPRPCSSTGDGSHPLAAPPRPSTPELMNSMSDATLLAAGMRDVEAQQSPGSSGAPQPPPQQPRRARILSYLGL